METTCPKCNSEMRRLENGQASQAIPCVSKVW